MSCVTVIVTDARTGEVLSDRRLPWEPGQVVGHLATEVALWPTDNPRFARVDITFDPPAVPTGQTPL